MIQQPGLPGLPGHGRTAKLRGCIENFALPEAPRSPLRAGDLSFMADNPSQLQILQAERARLASQLEGAEDWRKLQSIAVGGSPGHGAGQTAYRQQLEARLADNPVFQAWRKLGEVIGLLEAEARAEEKRSRPRLAPEHADLLRIRGLDEATAVQLVAAGTTTLKTIAGWTAADVKSLQRSLKLGRRISQEGWIEQAAMLVQQPAPASAATVAGNITEDPPSPRDIANRQLRPDSLTARLFMRTPLPGQPRSLRAAIEAAEQADMEASHSLLRRHGAVAGVAAPQPTIAAARTAEPLPAQSPEASPARPDDLPVLDPEPAPAERAIMSFLAEEEAEVVIVVRPKPAGDASSVSQQPAEDAGLLFAFDVEQQGGEGYDPRSVTALRGVIEEASVEIVKKSGTSQS